MPYEEHRLISSPSRSLDTNKANAAVITPRLAAAVLVILLILPLWFVQYVPLYDYQNHLLEARVLADYDHPQLGYSSFYEIRDGWYLRSNALTTLMMAGLGRLVSVELAGKAVLTLYILVLGIGTAALLHFNRRSFWLVLFLPLLVYNFTFTTGMLNWSFGFALMPWALLAYLMWQRKKSFLVLGALAVILLLIYVSHLFAWGLILLVLFTLAAVEGIVKKDAGWLLAVSLGAAPLLLVARPWFSLAPVVIFLVLWSLRLIILRLRLAAGVVLAAGGVGVVGFLVGVKLFQPQMQEFFPDIGYSSHTKTISIFQTLALPHYYGSQDSLLLPVNLLIMILVGLLVIIFSVESLKVFRKYGVDRWKWLAAASLLIITYFLTPTRTYDIIVTEPRILMVAFLVGIMAVKSPLPESKLGRAILPLLLFLSAASTLAVWYFTFRYDEAAKGWAQQIRQIPPAQRLLVFSNPLPEDLHNPLRIGQLFDQHQFANTYPLERGGFSSNTFFNGPLLPVNPAAIPPYWWIDFRPGPYVDRYCDRLIPEYDMVLLWNPRSTGLINSLNICYGNPEERLKDFWLWRSAAGLAAEE
jgi:hypothetical protein